MSGIAISGSLSSGLGRRALRTWPQMTKPWFSLLHRRIDLPVWRRPVCETQITSSLAAPSHHKEERKSHLYRAENHYNVKSSRQVCECYTVLESLTWNRANTDPFRILLLVFSTMRFLLRHHRQSGLRHTIIFFFFITHAQSPPPSPLLLTQLKDGK